MPRSLGRSVLRSLARCLGASVPRGLGVSVLGRPPRTEQRGDGHLNAGRRRSKVGTKAKSKSKSKRERDDKMDGLVVLSVAVLHGHGEIREELYCISSRSPSSPFSVVHSVSLPPLSLRHPWSQSPTGRPEHASTTRRLDDSSVMVNAVGQLQYLLYSVLAALCSTRSYKYSVRTVLYSSLAALFPFPVVAVPRLPCESSSSEVVIPSESRGRRGLPHSLLLSLSTDMAF